MSLKWTVFFLLSLSLAAKGFDLRRVGGQRGFFDGPSNGADKVDNDNMKPSDVLKPAEPRVGKDLPKSAETNDDGQEEDHVEHPIPPSGPMSRIVVAKVDSLGKPQPTTVDLVMDMKDSQEAAQASSREELSEKMDELKEADKNEKTEDIIGGDGSEDKSVESTTEKLETGLESKNVEEKADDDDEVTTTEAAPASDDKKDWKDGVVNAFHHGVTGNRKDYFRNAVSMMSKDELDDLHAVLLKALKPLADDDVDVEEVKEEFKEVVHELVEKQEESKDIMSDEKKDALIEIEHVLEESKQEPEEVKPEEDKEEEDKDTKQVIKMEDWKKEDVVGGIAQNKGEELPKPNIGLPIPTTVPEEKNDDEVKGEGSEAAEDKKDRKEEDVSIDKIDKEVPSPSNDDVKEVLINKAPEVPLNADEKKDEVRYKSTWWKPTSTEMPAVSPTPTPSSTPAPVPEEVKEKVKELIGKSGGILGGIMSKDQEAMMEQKKVEEVEAEAEEEQAAPSAQAEVIADSLIEPDETDEVIQIVPLKPESSEEEKEASVPVVLEEKLAPQKVLKCRSTSDESSEEGSDEKDVESRRGRGWGRGGPRRAKRHSRRNYRRRQAPGAGEGPYGPDTRRTRRAIYEDVGSGSSSQELSDFPPPTRLGTPMRTQYRQINDAGPPDPYRRSKQALGLPEITLGEQASNDIMDDIKEGLRYVLQTRNEMTFAIHGTGTTGGGAIMDNLIEEGDKVLVMSIGYWGDLMGNMSERLGAEVVRYEAEPGTSFQLREVAAALSIHRPQILAMVMGESDTAVKQNMEGIGELCRQFNTILAVDTVAVAGMQPVLMDKLKLDAIFTTANKGLGGVPGLAPVSLSPRAVEKLRNRQSPPRAYQTDLLIQARLWNTTDRGIFQSVSFPLLYALREALASIAEERMENTFRRHESATQHLGRGLEALGLKYFVQKQEDRMVGITAVLPPQGKDPKKIADYMFRNSNIAISSGFGPTTGRVLRIAVFASNANSQRVTNILRALKKALQSSETNI